MQPPVDPAFVGFPAASPKSSRISWFMVVVGCPYFVWLTIAFSRAIPHFTKLYGGVELSPSLPNLAFLSFLVSAIRVHRYGDAHRHKEIGRVTGRLFRVVNIVLIVIGAVLPALLVWFLYLPLFALIGRLRTCFSHSPQAVFVITSSHWIDISCPGSCGRDPFLNWT